MSPSRAQTYLAVIVVSVVALTMPAAAEQASAPPVAHTSMFGAPRLSTLGDGTVVVSFEAGGDLRGLVTLTLHPSGTAYAGEWAFTVAHADHTDPATGLDPELEGHDSDAPDDTGEGHPHKAFVTLVHQGSLAGTVSSAAVSRGPDGVLTDLQATLTIDQGALEFNGVTGSGQATLGSLNLLF